MADLLDMAGPQGMPDFAEMMRGTAPTMMPNAPSPAAGIMYGQDMSRHDKMIQEAAKLAKLRAFIQQQQAEEMSAAGPGRMAEIQNKSNIAQDTLNDPNSRALPIQQRATSLKESQAKGGAADFANIDEYLGAYDAAVKAKDPNAAKRIQAQMIRDGITKWRGQDITAMSPEDFGAFMTDMRQGQSNTPASALQRDIWGQYKKDLVIQQGANAASVADIRGRAMTQAAAIRAAATKAGYDTPKTAIEAIERKIAKDEPLTEGEMDISRAHHDYRLMGSQIRGAGFSPQAIMDGNGNLKLEKPAVPTSKPPGKLKDTPDLAPRTATNTSTTSSAAPVAVKSKAEYDKLEGGVRYIDPRDGKTYTKPK